MATQSGIVIEGPEKPYTIVNTIPRSSPGPKQALVKSLVVGINPVDPMMQHTGLLVTEWPAVLGSDYAGVVLEVGAECTKLKPGDHVYGCPAIGQNQFTPFQETFLVDENVAFKKSDNLSVEGTATIGAGLLTAALCLLVGMDLKLSEDGTVASKKDEWVVVLGGTGTVGQFAVQIAAACGYKVLASGSPARSDVAMSNGATKTFNNRASVDDQLAEIKESTGGNFARIFDTTLYGYEVMVKALENCSTATTKYLASVDDWSPFNTPATIKEYRVHTGLLGRHDDPIGAQVTKDSARLIPVLEAHLAAGTLRPVRYELADGVGWESVIRGIGALESGQATQKIVARVQEE